MNLHAMPWPFFAAFVLPLALIVLLHDLRASERQAGRHDLLLATAGSAATLWHLRAGLRSAWAYAWAVLPLVAGAVISGAATAEQAKRCMETVHEKLATPYGLMLCAPPLVKTSIDVMRAVVFNPGIKENPSLHVERLLASASQGPWRPDVQPAARARKS